MPPEETIIAAAKMVIAMLAACGIAVELTPAIKTNPISWALGKIGAAMNKELIEKVNALSKQMVDHEIDQLRWNILDFANSCRNGRRHTKEEFDHVIADHTRYLEILEKNHRKNGQVDADYRYIEEIYYKCMKDNDFL